MIKVYLPIDNDNLDLYFNTREASCNINKLNYVELEKILRLSLGGNIELKYEIVFEERSKGQYFIVETEYEKKWISVSADYTRIAGDGGSTNAYFVQFIPMALADCFLDITNKKKSQELYLKGTDHNRAKTKAQQIYYRLAKTVGIRLLNEYEFSDDIKRYISKPFHSINEWKLARLEMANANRGNKSSYIIENEDSYTFYGKTFGANGRESIFILYVLANLIKDENKKIFLYEVSDNGSFAFESSQNEESKKFKKMLNALNVVYYADSIQYVENEEYEALDDENRDARYQAEFMRNLLIKFNSKKDDHGNIVCDSNNRPIILDDIKRCYLCNCDIQRLIIASHIQRVTDINKLNIEFKEKRKLAVDGDNGLWLCANHDKLFEYGLIYFDNNQLKISDKLNEEQKKYVEYLTFDVREKVEEFNEILKESDRISENVFYIKECDYNETMHNYLEKHRIRTQSVNTID